MSNNSKKNISNNTPIIIRKSYHEKTYGNICDVQDKNKIGYSIHNGIKFPVICKKSKKNRFTKKKLSSKLTNKKQIDCFDELCWHRLSKFDKPKNASRSNILNLKNRLSKFDNPINKGVRMASTFINEPNNNIKEEAKELVNRKVLESKKIITENKNLKLENGNLKVENENLKVENESLKVENGTLNTENNKYETKNLQLINENGKLKTEKLKLKNENERLIKKLEISATRFNHLDEIYVLQNNIIQKIRQNKSFKTIVQNNKSVNNNISKLSNLIIQYNKLNLVNNR